MSSTPTPRAATVVHARRRVPSAALVSVILSAVVGAWACGSQPQQASFPPQGDGGVGGFGEAGEGGAAPIQGLTSISVTRRRAR
jgi:hypothetical protein